MKKRKISFLLLCLMLFMATSLQAKAASAPVSLQIEVKTELIGDDPPTAETFSFVLEAVDHAPMPENNMITVSGEGRSFFPSINYTEPETYTYTIREINGGTEGYIYDDTIYDVTVQVITDNEGTLAVSQYVSERESEFKTEAVKFVNQYKDASVKDPEESTEPDNAQTPKTGVNTNLVLWSVLGSAAFLILIGQFIFYRKNQNKKDS